MSFFNPAKAIDHGLLHASVREHDDVSVVAAQAEDDVVREFTERGDFGGGELHTETRGAYTFTVMLLGYDPDETEAQGYDTDPNSWSGFAKAMRETIADVTSHRLRYYDVDSTVTSETMGRRSETRQRGTLDVMWPRNWSWRLNPYDVRPKTFVI